MIQNSIYLIILTSLLISCKADQNSPLVTYYEVKQKGKIVVNKDLVQSTSPVCLKIFQFNGNEYLTYFDQTVAKIFIHRLESNNRLTFIDSVSTRPAFKKSYIMDYTLINLDTIAIAFNPSYTRDNHDTTLCIINRKGKLLSSIDFNDLPVPTSAKIKLYGKDVRNYAPNYLNYLGFPLFYHNQLKCLIGHFNCYSNVCSYHNDSNGNNEFHAALLYSGGLNKPIPNIAFGLAKDYYYSLNMRYPTGTYNTSTGEIIFSFRYHNLWQIVDTNLQVKKIKVDSYILDTIYPLNKLYYEFFDYSRGEFYTIHYNHYFNKYYRFLRVGNNVFRFNANSEIKPTTTQGVETYILQVINDKYSLEGEAIIPSNYTEGSLLSCKKGLILLNKLESSKTGSIVFDIVELNPKKISLANYKERLKKRLQTNSQPEPELYYNYINTIHKKSYSKNVIIHVDKGCVGCKEFMFSYLKDNIASMGGKDISLTLITTNKKNLLTKLGNPILPSNIFIDDKSIYRNEIAEVQNPALLYKDSNNNPAITKFTSSNIGELYSLLDSYKKW